MLKRLVLRGSVGPGSMALSMLMVLTLGSVMVPPEAFGGLAEMPAGVVYNSQHPGGGDPDLIGGPQFIDQPYVEVWTDRGMGSVYTTGERVNVYMRPAYDCYVIVYDIDTDGNLNLLFPYDSRDDGLVRGGQIYRLGMSGYGGYYVTGPSGVEYLHVLASFEPFRPLYWHGQAGYVAYAQECTWRGFSDYWGCALPPRVYGDPYVAMQSIDEFICYDALEAGIAFADFTYFYVEQRVSYPRYLCYDCHGYRPAFHPYVDACVGFHISFVACDPCYKPCSWWWWCSPKRVYCGPSYVCYSKKACNVPCKDPKPSYRWRTRSETFCDTGAGKNKTSYGEYYRERVRPGSGQPDGLRPDGGRSAEVVRVRPERDSRADEAADAASQERYLYSRKSSSDAVRSPGVIWSREDAGESRAGDQASTGRPETGRVEIRQVPARIERPEADSRKAEVPSAESREPAKASGWTKLVNIVRETVERKTATRSSKGTETKSRGDDSGKSRESKASDTKSRKTESGKGDSGTSGSSNDSRKSASKARAESKSVSQSTRRRVSD